MATINGELPRFFWRDELVQELIDLYRERPCLYDSKSKDYHNREMKKKCYEEMAEHVGASVEEVIKKLKCIRSQYSREKQKARLRKMRYGTDDVYTSRWVYYDRLSFLENYLVAKSGSNAMNGDLQVEDDMDSESFMVDGASSSLLPMEPPDATPIIEHIQPLQQTLQVAPQTMSPQQAPKTMRLESEEELLKRVIVCVEKAAKDRVKKSSTNEIFGQYVASELDDIESGELQRWAKQQITTILYQAQSGQLVSPTRSSTNLI